MIHFFRAAGILAVFCMDVPLAAQQVTELLSSPRPGAFAHEVPAPAENSGPIDLSKISLAQPDNQAVNRREIVLDWQNEGQGNRRWLYPTVGALVGGLAGVAWGAYLMSTAEDWIAPPAYIVTVPLGAAAGALVGFIVSPG